MSSELGRKGHLYGMVTESLSEMMILSQNIKCNDYPGMSGGRGFQAEGAACTRVLG